ncbi:MAG: hypothetical protein EBT27_08675, partial [Betaproteobacteria bacterium]|nr:hypothetical protein [Betaproteobacteria bacterium]
LSRSLLKTVAQGARAFSCLFLYRDVKFLAIESEPEELVIVQAILLWWAQELAQALEQGAVLVVQ